jgi:hypothetical protein
VALGALTLPGGAAFSLTASTNSTISVALIVNSGTYFPFAGHVTVGRRGLATPSPALDDLRGAYHSEESSSFQARCQRPLPSIGHLEES